MTWRCAAGLMGRRVAGSRQPDRDRDPQEAEALGSTSMGLAQAWRDNIMMALGVAAADCGPGDRRVRRWDAATGLHRRRSMDAA